LIRQYLEENERLFGIRVTDLLTVNGKLCEPEEVYRKVSAQALAVLAAATPRVGAGGLGPTEPNAGVGKNPPRVLSEGLKK
jgi:hypothetical protein